MTETATRTRARPRFKSARLKLSVISPKPALQRHSLHDQLVAKLREMILNSELRPGSPLPEKMLCESFGVSRTPLREAFKVLASEGLIELRPHRTPQITLIDPGEISAVFEVMVALERLEMRRRGNGASRPRDRSRPGSVWLWPPAAAAGDFPFCAPQLRRPQRDRSDLDPALHRRQLAERRAGGWRFLRRHRQCTQPDV